jgi:hypothetical protein
LNLLLKFRQDIELARRELETAAPRA